MIRKTLITAAALAFLAGPALANQCPKLLKQMDIDMGSENYAGMTTYEKKIIKELRNKAEEYHKAGNHKMAVRMAHATMDLLGMQYSMDPGAG